MSLKRHEFVVYDDIDTNCVKVTMPWEAERTICEEGSNQCKDATTQLRHTRATQTRLPVVVATAFKGSQRLERR